MSLEMWTPLYPIFNEMGCKLDKGVPYLPYALGDLIKGKCPKILNTLFHTFLA